MSTSRPRVVPRGAGTFHSTPLGHAQGVDPFFPIPGVSSSPLASSSNSTTSVFPSSLSNSHLNGKDSVNYLPRHQHHNIGYPPENAMTSMQTQFPPTYFQGSSYPSRNFTIGPTSSTTGIRIHPARSASKFQPTSQPEGYPSYDFSIGTATTLLQSGGASNIVETAPSMPQFTFTLQPETCSSYDFPLGPTFGTTSRMRSDGASVPTQATQSISQFQFTSRPEAYPYYGFPVSATTGAPSLLQSDCASNIVQNMSQSLATSPPDAAPARDRTQDFSMQHGTLLNQYQHQVVNEVQDIGVDASTEELTEEGLEEEQTYEFDLVQLKDTAGHACSGCSSPGSYCLDIMLALVAEYPDLSFDKQASRCISAAFEAFNSRLSTSALGGNTGDLQLSDHTGQETESLNSSTTATTATAVSLSPITTSPSIEFGTAPKTPSMGRTTPSIRKRKTPPKPYTNPTKMPTKKPDVNGEYVCLLCRLLYQPCGPKARKDSLKRHFDSFHPEFSDLVSEDGRGKSRSKEDEERDKKDCLKFLVPRWPHEIAALDLEQLLHFSLLRQYEALRNGATIREGYNFACVYPGAAAWLNLL